MTALVRRIRERLMKRSSSMVLRGYRRAKALWHRAATTLRHGLEWQARSARAATIRTDFCRPATSVVGGRNHRRHIYTRYQPLISASDHQQARHQPIRERMHEHRSCVKGLC